MSNPKVRLPSRSEGKANYAWALIRENGTPQKVVGVRLRTSGVEAEELREVLQPVIPGPHILTTAIELPTDENIQPDVTVVVCTRERPDGLRSCLRSLLNLSYDHFSILVVDNARRTKSSEDVCREFGDSRVEYVIEPRAGLSYARNLALETVQSNITAWLDDDEVADEDWLSFLVSGFRDDSVDVVSGFMAPAELDTKAQILFEQYGGHNKQREIKRKTHGPESRHEQSPLYPLPSFGTGGNMAIRSRVFERVPLFDLALGAGTPAMGSEDTKFFTDVLLSNGSIQYLPDAITRHYHRRTMGELERQMFGYGAGLTAFYASLVFSKPARIPAVLRLIPSGAREVYSKDGLRSKDVSPTFPNNLMRANKRGLLEGPARYVQGRLAARNNP